MHAESLKRLRSPALLRTHTLRHIMAAAALHVLSLAAVNAMDGRAFLAAFGDIAGNA